MIRKDIFYEEKMVYIIGYRYITKNICTNNDKWNNINHDCNIPSVTCVVVLAVYPIIGGGG